MAKIPLEAASLEHWTPPSLANMASPPVFTFRPWTVRDRGRYVDTLLEEGLRSYTREAMREETENGLKALWSEKDASAKIAELRKSWEQQDAAADQIPGIEDDKEAEKLYWQIVDRDLLKRAIQLQDDLSTEWEPLRKMLGRNQRFTREAPVLVVSMCLMGWTGVDAKCEMENGRPSYGCLTGLETALEALETEQAKTVEGIGEPGTAFGELMLKASAHVRLTREEAKNSASPPSSSDIPTGSKADGRGKTDGRSPAKTATKKNTTKTPPAS